MSAGFYKLNMVSGGLLYAPNYVMGPGFSLSKEDENLTDMEETNGWKWFETDSEAYNYFEITPESQPWTITPLQAKTALYNAGLLESVEAYMETADTPTKLAWNAAQEFSRTSSMLISIGDLLGLSETEIDNLFLAAKEIEV